MGKLGVGTDLQLVTLAAQHGLVASREVSDS
jgi:two-component system invasion response regulator UvrY